LDESDPVEIDIFNYRNPREYIVLDYWIRVFQKIEEYYLVSGLTFYVVWGNPARDLPSYGDDVVAVILADETCLIPNYLAKVRFVFKTYGFRPCSGVLRGQMNLGLWLKHVRDYINWARHMAVFVRKNRVLAAPHGGRMVIPLGYARQTDLPVRSFDERRFLVSFLGSIEHRAHPGWVRTMFGTPKRTARLRMASSLERLASAIPDDVFFATTRDYYEGVVSDGKRYSEIMADTKICVAPRGNSIETYRFFEGLRQGCIVICDRLPPHWFYTGCPAIQIRDWRNLEEIVKTLATDTQRMQELHRRSLDWWETKCSEKAVAALFAGCLERRGACSNHAVH
jgi:hypothetical protein